jgi:hypothetical protein
MELAQDRVQWRTPISHTRVFAISFNKSKMVFLLSVEVWITLP